MRTSRWLAALAAAAVAGCSSAAPPEPQEGPVAPADAVASSAASPRAPRVRLGDLPRGAPPRLAWVDHGEHVAAGGTRRPVPNRYGVSAAVPLRDGLLVADTRVFEGSVGLARYDSTGRRAGAWATTGSPVVSDDERLTAWATYVMPESGRSGPTLVHVAGPRGPERVHEVGPAGGQVSVVGFLDRRVVVDRLWGRGVVLAGPDGTVPVPGIRFAHDVDDRHDRVAGGTGSNGGTAVMVDARSGEVVWRAPGVALVSFSPDGTRVLAGTGRGGRWVVLHARTGAVRHVVDTPFPLWDAVWEDGDHLLAVVVQRRHAAVVRVGLDGGVELAAPPVPTDPSSPPYTLRAG
jgi:hypothetical protein